MYSIAITRRPCRNFANGLTTSKLGKPDFNSMLNQHKTYVDTLKNLGLNVLELDVLNDYPDAHFVEDTAVVVPEVAIIARPGAASRRGEEISIEKELVKYREIQKIEEPGTLDGGDILIVDKQVFIGLSDRTNQQGAQQLSDILLKYGYESKLINVEDGLHLKSDVNYIGQTTLLLTKKYIENPVFGNYKKIYVENEEAYSVNSLLINDKLIIPKGFAKTKLNLHQEGFNIIEIDMSESQKMDGGLTCLSLRF